MFQDVYVVNSAVSAFNNAALFAPAFLWWGLLSLPLMWGVWVAADVIKAKLGLGAKTGKAWFGAVTALMTMLWVVLFGGNYGVLRDGVSVLPFVVAMIVFLCSAFVRANINEFSNIKLGANVRFGLVVILLVALGLSDMHAWWGPLVQVGAFVFGWLFGRVASGVVRPVSWTVWIVLMTVVAMLMQPEFFRFGQLGNLTPVHLISLLLVGVPGAVAFVLYHVKSSGRIRHSVYIKLKWLMRVMALLMVALFLRTESVPLFLGAIGACGALVALSVWHLDNVPSVLAPKAFATMLFLFGVVTTMPVISAIAVLYWSMLPCERSGADFWALL